MNTINKLIKLANNLDEKGIHEEADTSDIVLKKKAQEREKFDATANKKYRIMHWTEENMAGSFSLIVSENSDYRDSNSYKNAVKEFGSEKNLLNWTEQYTEPFSGSIEEVKEYARNILGWDENLFNRVEVV